MSEKRATSLYTWHTMSQAAIRHLRLNAGLTQDELAERAGVSRTTLCNLERGYRPNRLGALSAIAAALGVSVESLVE